jgi:hypothetical protein
MLVVFVNHRAVVRDVLPVDAHLDVNIAVVKSVLFAASLRTALLKR